jgi:hypothetical protein
VDRVHTGMKVMTLDGQHLGKVAEMAGESLVIEYHRARLQVPAEEVASVLDHELFLRLPLRIYLPRFADAQRRSST